MHLIEEIIHPNPYLHPDKITMNQNMMEIGKESS